MAAQPQQGRVHHNVCTSEGEEADRAPPKEELPYWLASAKWSALKLKQLSRSLGLSSWNLSLRERPGLCPLMHSAVY